MKQINYFSCDQSHAKRIEKCAMVKRRRKTQLVFMEVSDQMIGPENKALKGSDMDLL